MCGLLVCLLRQDPDRRRQQKKTTPTGAGVDGGNPLLQAVPRPSPGHVVNVMMVMQTELARLDLHDFRTIACRCAKVN
jgi:hypothetical protein